MKVVNKVWGFALSLSNAAGVYATTTSTGEKAGAGGFSGAAFTIESKTGQLRVKAMEALNFEMVAATLLGLDRNNLFDGTIGLDGTNDIETKLFNLFQNVDFDTMDINKLPFLIAKIGTMTSFKSTEDEMYGVLLIGGLRVTYADMLRFQQNGIGSKQALSGTTGGAPCLLTFAACKS